MRDDLPFSAGFGDYVSTTHSLASRFLEASDTKLTEPRETDLGAGVTVCKEGPVGIAIVPLTTPFREGVQPISDCCIAGATNVPWG